MISKFGQLPSACNFVSALLVFGLVTGALLIGSSAIAQDTVTISKARLAELERKEAELEKLKRELQKIGDEKAQLQPTKTPTETTPRKPQSVTTAIGACAKAVTPPPQSSVIAKDAPAIAKLPPLAANQVVEAQDLMIHYRTEPAAAAKRYEAERIRVVGEIAGFDKPMFVRHAVVTLRTTEGSGRIVCRVEPPANLPTLFTAKQGEELIGSTSAGARSVLARVGQRVVIEGWCKGLKDQSVILSVGKLVGDR